ncbi:protein MNN4-like [Cucumis melo var. makuwa]|uniref:Protein MNN4-like n=2 Tax=Cucumis melo TaxID=3656 RepID=A0A5A7TTT3_CUCMM|nr:protein MNN4-like [Cucumis melo var. makuwa]
MKETKLRELKKLLSQVEKVALSVEKGKDKENNFDEHCEEFKKEIEELSPLLDEMVRPAKKRKVAMKKKTLRAQF